MYQKIAEVDNATAFGDAISEVGIDIRKTIHCLADNLELAFNSGPHHYISLIIRKIRVTCKLLDARDCKLNVIEYGLGFNLHIASA